MTIKANGGEVIRENLASGNVLRKRNNSEEEGMKNEKSNSVLLNNDIGYQSISEKYAGI